MTSKTIYMPTMCSCVVCRKEFSTKGFHTHYQRIHENSQSNYKNKTEKAVIASREKAYSLRTTRINKYNETPKYCQYCNEPIPFDKRINTYCSSSCAAHKSNRDKDYTKIRTGPPKGYVNKSYTPKTNVKQCVICEKFHGKTGRTCSSDCKSKLLSISIRTAISNGFNPSANRGRGKRSYLESSFSEWVTKNFPELVVYQEYPFKRHDQVKTYFADFYFPNLNLIIELDGTQHKKSAEYDNERDCYINRSYGVNIIRISHKEYTSKQLIPQIKEILSSARDSNPQNLFASDLEGPRSTN